MDLTRRTDAELLRMAAAGLPAAFAVLLRRHADLLAAAAGGSRDPVRTARRLGVRTMRALREPVVPADVRGWLADRLGVAAGPAPERPDAADVALVSRTWIDLAARWPDGRRQLRLPVWARWAVAAGGVLAVGALGTFLLLTSGAPDPVVAQLLAYPYDPPDDEDDDFVTEAEVEGDLEDLPFYELPAPVEGSAPSGPVRTPTPAPAPEPVPSPEDPGTDPGTDPGADPGTDPGADPGTGGETAPAPDLDGA